MKNSVLKYVVLQYCALCLYYVSTLLTKNHLQVSEGSSNPLFFVQYVAGIIVGVMILSSFFTTENINKVIIIGNIVVLILLSLLICIKPLLFTTSFQFLLILLIGMNIYFLIKKETN